MLNQQKNEINNILKVGKVFVVFTLSLTILHPIFLNPLYYLYAQKLTPELIACNQSAQARFKCFMKQREGELERAKAIDALSSSILEAKEKLRFELVNLEKKTTCK